MGGFVSKLAEAASEYLPKIFSNEITETGIRSGEAATRRLGPYGEVLVNATKKWQDQSAQQAGQAYSSLLKAFKPFMSDKTLTKDLATHWQNYDKLPEGPLKEAIKTAKMNRLQTYADFMKSGLRVGKLEQDDWPRMYPKDWFEGVNREQTIKSLISKGMSARQAERLMDNLAGKSPRAHNYETPRKWDLPGYRRDLGVIFEDVDKAAKRLNYAKTFGPNDEILDYITSKIQETHGRSGKEYATRYMDAILKNGKYYRGTAAWEQGLASLQVASKLSLAVLSHTSQPLNLAIYSGRLKPMIKAMGEMVSELVSNGNVASGEDFALRAGATWTESMRRYRELYGTEVGGFGSKVLHATGFVSLDKYRRIYASVTGKYLAEDLFGELTRGIRPNVARSRLAEMGIDVDKAMKRGSLSEDDLLQAAKRTSDVTQFTFDANQLPTAWKSSPSARLILQFKQYFYTQSKFIKDFAVKPAYEYLKSGGSRGEITPLIYMSLLFPTFGELTADLREYARKGTLEERPQYPLERALDNMAHAGAFGIYGDLIYNIASPSDTPIWHFVTGPTLSDIVDLARLPHTKQPIGLELLRRTPIVGPAMAKKYQDEHRKRPRTKGMLERGIITNFIEDASR